MHRINEIGNRMIGGEKAALYAGAGIFFPVFFVIDSLVSVLDRFFPNRFVALVRYFAIAYQIAFVLFLHPNADWSLVSLFLVVSGFHPVVAVVPPLFERNEQFIVRVAYGVATATTILPLVPVPQFIADFTNALATTTMTIFCVPGVRLPQFVAKLAAVAHALAFLGNDSKDYWGDLISHALFTLRALSFGRAGFDA